MEAVDLRLCATLEMPGDVLASFDVGLDLERRDELVLVGTDGVLVAPDPWLCRPGHVELTRSGHTERLAADPDDAFDLAGDDSDAYRIEFDVVSAAIADGSALAYGREDAVAQAGVLQALRRAGREVQPAGASTP